MNEHPVISAILLATVSLYLNGPVRGQTDIPTCGERNCEYIIDDGESDFAFDCAAGDTAWVNAFETRGPCNIIVCVRVQFGETDGANPPGHYPVRLFIYDDPSNDGDPEDAVLLWSDSTSFITANEGLPVFNEYDIDPLIVHGVFFVCVAVDAPGTPAAVDMSSIEEASWLACDLSDPDDPLNDPGSLVLFDDIYSVRFGNWMLRVVGEPGCHGETNGDYRVDVNDLNNVISDWGTDGSANGGDVTGPLNEPPDGTVDVNDLNAVFVGWGDCPLYNDLCNESVLVTGAPAVFHSNGASLDGSAPGFSCGSAENDVWLRYEVSSEIYTGTLHLATCGSEYDTILEVYETWDCPPSLEDFVECNDDGPLPSPAGACVGTLQSGLSIPTEGGQRYTIRIGGWIDESEGSGMINAVLEEDLPPNDDCATALGNPAFELIDGAPRLAGRTLAATPDPQAFNCGLPVQSPGVWYWFVGDGVETTITVDCFNTDYDASMHVYCADNGCDGLLCIGGDDDGCGMSGDGVPPTFTFCAEFGRTYAVLVDGGNGEQGRFEISLTQAASCNPPDPCRPPLVNDECQDYLLIGEGLVAFLTGEAEIEPDGPPSFDCGDQDDPQTWSDIWFCYQADTGGSPEGLLVLSTCQSLTIDGMTGSADFDTEILLYGPFSSEAAIPPTCGVDLIPLTLRCNDEARQQPCGVSDGQSVIAHPVQDGDYFLIRLGGEFEGEYGSGELLVNCLEASNDFCEFATDLGVPPPGAFDGLLEGGVLTSPDTSAATVDVFTPSDVCVFPPVAPGVWIRVTGNGNIYGYQVCDFTFNFDTRVSILCGPCDDLECFQEESNNAYCSPFTEEGQWCTRAGEEYFLLVHGDFIFSTGSADVVVANLGMPCTDPPCQPCLTPWDNGSDSACAADIDEADDATNNPNPESCRQDGDDDLNGGCVLATPAFGVIVTGQTLPYAICGTTGTFVNGDGAEVPDVDWHLYTPTVSGQYVWNVEADFRTYAVIGRLSAPTPDEPDCAQFTLLAGAFGAGDCLPGAAVADLNAGETYVLFASIRTSGLGGQNLSCTVDDSGGAYRAEFSSP